MADKSTTLHLSLEQLQHTLHLAAETKDLSFLGMLTGGKSGRGHTSVSSSSNDYKDTTRRIFDFNKASFNTNKTASDHGLSDLCPKNLHIDDNTTFEYIRARPLKVQTSSQLSSSQMTNNNHNQNPPTPRSQ